MLKLLLKYIMGLILLTLIAGITLFLIANHFWQSSMIETVESPNLAVFHSVQTRLIQHPYSDWPLIIKDLQPKNNSTTLTLLSLSKINLSKDQIQILKQGKPITLMSNTVYYFGYGLSVASTYWRVGHSDWVLKISGIAMESLVQAISGWMTHLMQLDLEQTPEKNWSQKLETMKRIYHLPLSIFSQQDLDLTPATQQLLTNRQVVLGPPNSSGNIETIYIKLNHDSVLKVGPISYPFYPQNSQIILIAIFIFLVIVSVIVATILFSQNLERIYQMTHEYSHGNFSSPLKIRQHSTLHTLYKNIVAMGSQIQNLMESQANLTRFVAHDCRTPVATILFAINRLEKEALSVPAKKEIDSLKEDLSDLNQLINDFLYYAKFNSKDLIICVQPIKVNEWLAACVEKYQHAAKNICYFTQVDSHDNIIFDPKLLKQALSNLIDNAIKHAKDNIQITMQIDDSTKNLIISVEDDGATISEGDKDRIFQPFVRLENLDDINPSGFGLGLAIAKRIVEAHQGHLTVSDSKLGGTCFTIILP